MPGTQFQLRGGTAAECDAMIPAAREMIIDTTNTRPRVGNGATPGGIPLLTAAELVARAPTYVGTAGGTANALTLGLSPAPLVLSDGLELSFRVLSTNTGAAALSLNGGPSYPVRSGTGGELSAGQLVGGTFARVKWTGAEWRVQGGSGTFVRLGDASPAGSPTVIPFLLPAGYLKFRFDFEGLCGAIDATCLAQLSNDGGSTYLTGNADYQFGWTGSFSPGFAAPTAFNYMSMGFAPLANGGGIHGEMTLTPAVPGQHGSFYHSLHSVTNFTGQNLTGQFGGVCVSQTRPTAIRFAFNTTAFANRGRIIMSGLPV
jgi:hypothetical protein